MLCLFRKKFEFCRTEFISLIIILLTLFNLCLYLRYFIILINKEIIIIIINISNGIFMGSEYFKDYCKIDDKF